MSELRPVLQDLVTEAEAGRACALCAVVQTRGSTPQVAGAAMLVRSDFQTRGTLGGGCVEAEVRRRAFELLRERKSGLLDFLLNHDYGWDDGLICGGRMHIGVMPVTSETDLTRFRAALAATERREATGIAIEVEHDAQRLEYVLRLEATPTLLIAGAGHVGQALARLAAGLDFHVVVVDDRADYASRDRFAEPIELATDNIAEYLRRYPIDTACYVVIVTRGHQNDHRALDAVARSPAAYIGLIGSKRKSRMILKDLRESGVPPEMLNRVHTPIGLPIGAVTVPEIAVSIAAQLVEVRRRNATSLVIGPRVVGEQAVAISE